MVNWKIRNAKLAVTVTSSAGSFEHRSVEHMMFLVRPVATHRFPFVVRLAGDFLFVDFYRCAGCCCWCRAVVLSASLVNQPLLYVNDAYCWHFRTFFSSLLSVSRVNCVRFGLLDFLIDQILINFFIQNAVFSFFPFRAEPVLACDC